MALIKRDKSIIPSCDVDSLEVLQKLVSETSSVEGIGAYKIGFELSLRFGIPKVVETIKAITDLPIIYDHQKAGTDIPDTGEKFARSIKGVDAVILFPMTGPIAEKAWIDACKDVEVIVGGEMTHKAYLVSDAGYIDDNAIQKMYAVAAEKGITDFVVPGNKPDKIKLYADFLIAKGVAPTFYSPGLGAQGGSITQAAQVVERWHAIVGRTLYQAQDMHKAAQLLVKELDR